MHFSIPITSAFLLAAFSYASPVARQESSITDVQILQFALTLEHLENTFYTEALSKFDNQSFTNASLPDDAYGRFQQISQHEATHVKLLTETLEALGENATQACNYTFPYDDPKSFAKLSEVIEGVGTSAYLGAAGLLQNKTLVTASGAILTTEARQNAWIATYVTDGYPWSGPYDTPLPASLAFSLAKPFITACPSSNPQLPVTDFPVLTVDTEAQNLTAGGEITVSFEANSTTNGDESENSSSTSEFFLALKRGLETYFVELQSQVGSDTTSGDNSTSSSGAKNYTATLPSNLQGTVYAFVTNTNSTQEGDVSDGEIVTGAAVLMFALPADADNSN